MIGGADPGAQLVVNRSVDGLTGKGVILDGNILRGSTYDALTVNGSPDSGSPAPSLYYTISNNQILGAQRTPFSATYIQNLKVRGNFVDASVTTSAVNYIPFNFDHVSGAVEFSGNTTMASVSDCMAVTASATAFLNIYGNHMEGCAAWGMNMDTIYSYLATQNTFNNATSGSIRATNVTSAGSAANNLVKP
jgi:hypothetical protein